MKRINGFILVTILLANSVSAFHTGVVPVPRMVENTGDTFILNDYTRIIAAKNLTLNGWFAIAQLQNSVAQRRNLSIDVTDDLSFASEANTILVGNPEEDQMVASRMKGYGLRMTEEMEKEGYVLGIGKDGIVIGAVSDAGILYGSITLKQIILSRPGDIYSGEVKLPGIRIRDWPALEMRGIHDDVARGQVSTVDNYKEIIRSLSEFKMNTLMLYMEDLFRFKAYPEIGIGRGAFTKNEIDELEAFARPYNVQIIPIFQLLDHMPKILSNREFLPLAEFPGSGCLRICDSTYEFLENCVSELASAFDSKYFHAGLDESWDLGTGRSKALVDSLGRAMVHAQHYIKMYDLLAKYGKQMLFYNRVSLEHPEILDTIPDGIIHMVYNYSADNSYPGVVQTAEAGFKFGVHPGMSNWRKFFPSMSYAFVNIRNLTTEAVKQDAWGSSVCTWGDKGGKNFRELVWYGYAWQGEVAWSPETTDIENFSYNYFNLWNGPGTASYFRYIYELLEDWPEGWNRGRPIVPYFRNPFLPLTRNYNLTLQEQNQIEENVKKVLSLLEELRPLVVYRKGDLDYLEFVAKTYLNFMQSISLVRDLNALDSQRLSSEDMEAYQTVFFERISAHRAELASLRDMFSRLWLRTNLPANLQYNINDYNRLIKVWDDVSMRVQNGLFSYYPLTPSQWIYHPDGFVKNDTVRDAFFRKTFTLPPEFRKAQVQLSGDTHVRLFVNGEFIGEQYTRYVVIEREDATIKLYDISPYLKDSLNVIAVEAHNYLSGSQFREPGGPAGCAGFHLYGEVSYQHGKVEQILSGSDWKVSGQDENGWKEPGFDDCDWQNAMGDTEPKYLVTYPDFNENKRGFCDLK